MKSFSLVFLLTLAMPIFAAQDFLVLTKAQKEIVNSDVCAKAAVDYVVGIIIEDLKDGGDDIPDHLVLRNLRVMTPKEFYAVTFEGDATTVVRTRPKGKACKAISAGRVVAR